MGVSRIFGEDCRLIPDFISLLAPEEKGPVTYMFQLIFYFSLFLFCLCLNNFHTLPYPKTVERLNLTATYTY